jgi:hypothetical protein
MELIYMNYKNDKEKLENTLSNGKIRGYSEERKIDNINYIYEYSIKKHNDHHYIAYFFP